MYEKTYRSGSTGKTIETGWQPETTDLPPEDYLADELGGEEETIEDSYEGPETVELSLTEVQAYLRSALLEAKERKDETAVATLQGLIGRANHAAALSPASQRAELNAILNAANASSQTDLGEAALEGANPEAGETQILKGDIDELQSKLKDLNDETQRENLEDALKDAEKALKSSNLEKAQELYDAAEIDFEEVKGEQDTGLKENEDKLKAMRSQIENSNLVASKKGGLLQQLKQIEDQVTELSPEELSDKLKALSKAVGTEKKRSELSEKFPGFSSKIPSFGDNALTQDIAGKISQAIQSGNWQPVLSKLNPNAEGVNKGWLYYSVVQIVGTLCYSLAKQDEKQMELLLDLFPTDVRQAMANCMTGYETDNKWSSRETDKQTYNIYGSGQQVKDRLNESIAKDDIQFEIASNFESSSS